MRLAFVYDRINKFGGAERVLLALHQIWPQAPLYTAVYDQQRASWAKVFQVIPSFIQKIPRAKKHHEIFPWLTPFAFESFDLSNFDVVISLTSAEAKGIITQPRTMHLCYCLTPTRYLWSGFDHYLANPCFGFLNPLAKLVMKPVLKKMRSWDKVAAQRPDFYLAISKTVQKRIKKYYQRQSEVIYPFVDLGKFKLPVSKKKKSKKEKNYFLTVSRLVSYKRVDIVVKAFNQLKLPLKIIGDGTEKKKLQRMAKENIQFLDKHLTDKQLISYYQNCAALVFAGEEDLGLVSLEAQACGRPVIAFRGGGMAETVKEGETGLLFDQQTSQALIKTVSSFKAGNFSQQVCYQNAQKFTREKFIKKFKSLVEDKWKKYQNWKPR